MTSSKGKKVKIFIFVLKRLIEKLLNIENRNERLIEKLLNAEN